MNNIILLIIITILFTVGYKIVSYVYDTTSNSNSNTTKNKQNKSYYDNSNDKNRRYKNNDESHNNSKNKLNDEDSEYDRKLDYYKKVLGIDQSLSPDILKSCYKQMLKKYHPDKVSHLGREFQEIAEQKSKEINIAYDFIKKHHGFV